MVKSFVSIFITLSLLLGAALFEWWYVDEQFESFQAELTTLYQKAENETANAEDASAVFRAWENRKDKLHVWIPHNDITRIDDYFSEALKYIDDQNYTLALAKLEILLVMCENLPSTYRLTLANIF